MPTAAQKHVNSFVSRLNTAAEYHKELLVAVEGKRRQAALETMLCEQFAFNVIVLWEVFLSDLLVHYLAASPDRFKKELVQRITQSTRQKFGAKAAQLLKFSPPQILTLGNTRALLDPLDYNMTVQSADNLAKRANQILEARYAKLFSLPPEKAQFLDYVIALRNYLAHRSKGSHRKFKESLNALVGINLPLKAAAPKVGNYLKFRDAAGQTRATLVAIGLADLANSLS